MEATAARKHIFENYICGAMECAAWTTFREFVSGKERMLEHCGAWALVVPMYQGICEDCSYHSDNHKKSGLYLAVRVDLFKALVDRKLPHHGVLFFRM